MEGVPVRITSPADAIVDLFRYRKSVGHNLKEALRTRKAMPGDLARLAAEAARRIARYRQF